METTSPCSGTKKDLAWFRREIRSRFDVKFRGRIGPSQADDKHIRILNRVIDWGQAGITYEADQRHAEIVARTS